MGEAPDLRGERLVIGFARADEECAEGVVVEPVHEARFAERRFAAFRADLTQHPFEVLAGRVGVRENVDGVLE